jgi:hypothetical protein
MKTASVKRFSVPLALGIVWLSIAGEGMWFLAAGMVATFFTALKILLVIWFMLLLSAIFFARAPILLPLVATLNLIVCIAIKPTFPGWGTDIESLLYVHSVDILLVLSSWVAFSCWIRRGVKPSGLVPEALESDSSLR